ncbi:UDP-glucose 4-epimerase GalE [Halomonas dongshanensis]|uniref:UDP-glucose 4-epimerase n=1 Tax=Halomonas dongshanensis TaxID=2890835 RepID=A0ABT2EEH2_9GAMM|nr:UDP-glucose 4-epimerase GalE [Halomonas dongshanensis]MCS2609037.1 UDP-glucose 4-epimerase GalE [Halomonas dongshanensis]
MILLTGGTGYIGSHIAVELLEAGYDVILLDNLCNSQRSVVTRIEQITQRSVHFHEGDICDYKGLSAFFARYDIDAVIHCAGLKAVGESISKPLEYYDNNVSGTLCLLKAMRQAGVMQLVFSSSATVYGEEAAIPYIEHMPRGRTTSPYGTSKAMIEKLLEDASASDSRWAISILRYFNPVGAHPSGFIGEAPQGIPNNLMPYISQVAAGQRAELAIFGDDYPTPDGTCVRDYLHVVDLAKGHLKALQYLSTGVDHFNLGTGQGVSVREMVATFERATGVTVPYRFAPRRSGDLPAFWASAEKARKELGWQAEKSVHDMVVDTWRWQQWANRDPER